MIPTRNEADNVEELLAQIDTALGSVAAEILFVDDSDDDTPSRIRDASAGYRRQVGVLHRERGDREGGLGSAVVAGFGQARAPWAVVMDGDLQHPPTLIPDLVNAGRAPGVDLVVASRYSGSGQAAGLDGRWRTSVSALSTHVSKVMFPNRLRGIADPMSGFFAVRLAALDVKRLRPSGYKILLEILARSNFDRTSEVSYTFQPRYSGQSKASLKEGLRFARQLVWLRLLAGPSGLRRLIGFSAVGASGVLVNTALLWVLIGPWHVHYLLASAAATQVAIGWNFVLLNRGVFRAHTTGGAAARFARFWLVNLVLLPVQLLLLAVLVNGTRLSAVLANVVVLIFIFGLRYAAISVWVFRPAAGPAPGSTPPPPRARVGGLAPANWRLSSSATRMNRPSTLVVEWTVRGLLVGMAVLIAVVRPGAWLPFVTLSFGVALAHLAGWRGRQLRMVALGLAVFAAAVDYLSWRLTVMSWTAWFIAVPLFLAEAHAALHTVGLQVSLWPQEPAPLREDADPTAFPIVVFIPTVDEGPHIIEQTVRGVLAARDRYRTVHPEASVRVVVCNDGAVAGAACSNDVIAVADRLNVECVTRTEGGGAKAGNFENARQLTGGTGEALLVIFDADQIPRDTFLLDAVPPFRDATVGWVQTGQFYRNRGNPVARWADDQQSLFYRLLCPAKADHDAAFICGTNVIIRAAALDEIGGLPTDSVTEDFAASIMLAPRWRSVYLPGVYATGLGPVDLRSYLRQQERWARGTLTVLGKHWRDLLLPRHGGLRPAQRLQYSLAATHYLAGLRDLVFLLAPVLFLVTGLSGVRGATWGQFLEYFVPYYLLAIIAFWHAAWRTTSWRSIVISFASTPALLLALSRTLIRKRVGFNLTPKRRGSVSPYRGAWPFLLALGGCAAALLLAVTVRRSPAHWLAAFWLAYLCLILIASLTLVAADARLARRETAAVQSQSLRPVGFHRRNSRWGEAALAIRSERGGRLPRPASPRRGARFVAGAAAVLTVAAIGMIGTRALAGSPTFAGQYRPVLSPGHPRVGLSGTAPADSVALLDQLHASPTLSGRTFELADTFDLGWAQRISAAGGVPWLTLVTTHGGVAGLDSSLTAIGNGVDDPDLHRWAEALARYSKPLYLTMLPQVDRDFAASSAVARDGIPADASTAWTHLRAVFTAAHANNVSWVWDPAKPDRDTLYSPPVSALDAVAVTLYEYPGTSWVDPAAALAAAAKQHPGKPLLVEASAAGISARGRLGQPGMTRAAWLALLARSVVARIDVAGLVYHVDGPYQDPADPAARPWGLVSDHASLTAAAAAFHRLQIGR